MHHRCLLLAASALVASLAVPGASAETVTTAREGSPSSATVYPRSHFDTYAPSTALDIVSRVPGFSIDFGSDRRGFDGTGGNVLIDGARPASKSGGLREALERIPADSVERVELITNPTMAAASGQTLIVNVVLGSATRAGTWRTGLERNRDGTVTPSAKVSLTTPLLGWRVASSVELYTSDDPNDGVRTRRDATGTLLLVEQEARETDYTMLAWSAEATRDVAGGELKLNARLGSDALQSLTNRLGFAGPVPGSVPSQLRIDSYEEDAVNGEAGVSYGIAWDSGWRSDTLTLARWSLSDELSGSMRSSPPGVFASGVRAASGRDSFEWIGRSVVAAPEGRAWRPEIGVEVAYNRLDATLDFSELGAGGVITPIPLPSANVVVDEWRYETFANVSSEIWKGWTLDAGLAFEASNIAVRGGAQQSQSLQFLKPSVSLAWRPLEKLSVRAGLRREVGQLDFDGFAASANTGSDRTLGGNPELRPDSATRASLDVDYRIEGGIALNLAAFHAWKKDVQEAVILDPGGPGVSPVYGFGNAGKATTWGATLTAASPLPFGFNVDASLSWVDAAFDDPITGQTRRLNGVTPFSYSLELRQELPEDDLSWGVRVSNEGVETSYFVPETSQFDYGVDASVYVKATLSPKLTATLSVGNVREFRLDREFYDPTRAGTLTQVENRQWDRGPDIGLSLEGRF